MLDIVKSILGILTGGASTAGGAVAELGAFAALVAAATPGLLWLVGNKDGVFITVTYGEMAFWGTMMGLLVVVMVKLAHRAPAP